MTVSLRAKLFIILSGLVLFFVLMFLGLTRVGLEKFYISQKKEALIINSTNFDLLYQGNPKEMSLELERITNTLGAAVIIFTKEGQIKYSSFGSLVDEDPSSSSPPPPFITNSLDNPALSRTTPPRFPPGPPPIIKSREIIDNRTILEMEHDQALRIDFMVIRHKMTNDDILIIKQPLALISESVSVAAQFIIFTGILAVAAGCIWAFFFAKRFTLPIIELNRIAQSMSQLDFSQKCIINRNDEIGELGNSINHLSYQLDTAISELNKKNQQLMADVEKERKLDTMRKNFVSSVSHELKTPLSLILGYAEGLRENVARDEDSKNYYCSVIIDEAEKMDKLVKDLLNLSQIESGFFQLSRNTFDLSLLLHDILLKYSTILTERKILLEMNNIDPYVVYGDELRIEQVLLNLFTNAIDHAEFKKIIKIWVKEADNQIRVFMYNSGRPIPEESLEKIWTSFYKVDKARTREYGGYGLGLSIVRAIQELHGNHYGVNNVEDGVVFWFDLTKAKI
ncbi:sensor histidine kinase [Pelosinus baikalensis]|uniref:histidine kinase n=1 Tax=Pelosinus baikalensis TaxID=2892015 RepID=A0ABS8HVI5_9FIRM|nr:HAMP domain-containing sensor histidine kinase [Pelosinus baikalensis]MCC5467175.1 HAMP domain-containing histidine kinase [Pelosinus baikalensis]